MPPSLIARLTALRKKQGLSQEDLGARLGVTGRTVYRWESGKSPSKLASRAIELYLGRGKP